MRYTIPVILLMTSAVYGQVKTMSLHKLDSGNVASFFADKKVIVIGEMHGTSEVPQFVSQLIGLMSAKFDRVTVALEIERNYQQQVDEFLDNGDFDKLLALDYFKVKDGRTSEAMTDLIKELRTFKNVQVVCFDIESGDQRANRDSLMAVNLSSAYTGDRMIVLTGNLHATLKEGYWQPGFKSAAYYFNTRNKLGDKMVSLYTYVTPMQIPKSVNGMDFPILSPLMKRWMEPAITDLFISKMSRRQCRR
jgi:hypothetical protein